MTRQQAQAIRAYTTAVLRARAEYARDPFAATRTEALACGRCRAHHGGGGGRRRCAQCAGRALHPRGGYTVCACWLNDHQPDP